MTTKFDAMLSADAREVKQKEFFTMLVVELTNFSAAPPIKPEQPAEDVQSIR